MTTTRPNRKAANSRARLLSAYETRPGVADELFDAGGNMRPVWAPFIDHLAALGTAEIAERFQRGDQYLRDAGVYFHRYGNEPQQERDWPLSHVPVVLDHGEWRTITAGLVQRAELLERVMADLYGPRRLVTEGHLPAELIAQNPQWLRPMVGIPPRSGHFLHHLAFEIGRGPDGAWFVLGDRTQAPSGAGFALENRMATSRVFSDPFPRSTVYRLAGFFRAFREAMDGLRGVAGSRTAILTPGPGNDTYFEHTYIARYLGLMLLEGEDLTVRDDQVMVRTVAGLQPVDVIWRRLDAAFADPLELDEASQIGTPGLVGALRARNVSLVNALGAGVLETRAMLAFLPRICQVLMNAPLALPNIATWWCGQPSERGYVKDNVDRMLIGDAMSVSLPFDTDDAAAVAGHFTARANGSVADWIEAEGPRLAGQEAVTLSTTPAYSEGRLVPRPMTVRVFAARTLGGWQFMPGGYARIGRTGDATALAMQRGGSVADVWVMADAPVQPETLLPETGDFRRATAGVLPSRAADNLYWLGRYVERTEGLIRLLRAYHLRLAESWNLSDPRVAALKAFHESFDVDVTAPVPQAIIDLLAIAAASAGKVRDRFSRDGWAALTDLAKTAREMTATALPGDDCARAMSVLLRKITGFAGLVHENMYRSDGWRFLALGRALERADGMAAVLATFADPEAPDGSLDIAVEVGDSVMTHRQRYRIETNRSTVIDLLALDESNPRAIVFQLGVFREEVARLPGAAVDGRLSPLSRSVLTLQTQLSVAMPDELTTERLLTLRNDLMALSELLTAAYLR